MELYEVCRKLKENKGETNYIGSFFSLYLQEWKTRIMEVAISFIINKTSIAKHPKSPYYVLTYEYDGMKLLRGRVAEYGMTKLLTDLQTEILRQTGFSMVFEKKLLNHFMK